MMLSCDPEKSKETTMRMIKQKTAFLLQKLEIRNVQCLAVFKNQLIKCKRVSKPLNLSSSDVWETRRERRYQRLFGIPDLPRPQPANMD